MAIDKGKRELSEEEIDEMISSGKWTPVDTAPINPNGGGKPVGGPPPSHGVDPFSSGPLPPNFGYQPALVKTGYSANSGPIGLMPIYQSPIVGSAIKSHTQPIQETANAANETAGQAQTTATNANATATTASTGVTTINGKSAVAIVSGVLQQVPISTLGTSTATPNQDNLNDGSTFGRVLNTALTLNQIDSTKAGFLAQSGSTVGQIVGTTASIFSYTATTTTATVTWSAITVYFADGTNTMISSGSQGITGLSASTTYYLYPYFVAGTTTVAFATVASGLGTPAILYNPQNPLATQEQNLRNSTALSTGGIAVVTPSSGSGGGSGGGSGLCLKSGQHIESKSRSVIRIEDVELGEFIAGRSGWTEVVLKQILPQKTFVRVTSQSGERITLAPTHPTTVVRNGIEQVVRASDLSLSDFLITRDSHTPIVSVERLDEAGMKVSIECHPDHEFYASESKIVSLLVHNQQFHS